MSELLDIMKQGPVTIALACILLVLFVFIGLWKTGIISLKPNILTRAWVDRAERRFGELHKLASEVNTLLLRIERIESDLKSHLTEAGPLMREFEVLKSEVGGLTKALEEAKREVRDDQREIKESIREVSQKLDNFGAKLMEFWGKRT